MTTLDVGGFKVGTWTDDAGGMDVGVRRDHEELIPCPRGRAAMEGEKV